MDIALVGITDSVRSHMNQSADSNGPGRKTGAAITEHGPPTDGLTEIKHPFSAIMANADAARRWLDRTEPNFREAIAALERIVKDSSRIDDAIAGIRATGIPNSSLA